jgi:hypothetical protein
MGLDTCPSKTALSSLSYCLIAMQTASIAAFITAFSRSCSLSFSFSFRPQPCLLQAMASQAFWRAFFADSRNGSSRLTVWLHAFLRHENPAARGPSSSLPL